MKILIDGPDQILYQWDKGQRLMLHGADAGTRVDFARCDQNKAVSVNAYAEAGAVFCDIPDALLMEPDHLHGYVYEMDGDRGETVQEFMLTVFRRPMPEDYVAPNEVLTWHSLERRIKKIEDEGVPDEKIAQAVEDYLEENPVQPGGSAGTVEIVDAVDRPPGSPPTVTETEDSTPAARKYILGIPGGTKGVGIKDTVVMDSPNGYTKVTISYTNGDEYTLTIPHGKDYSLTPADKAEIAGMAAELVEVPEQDSSQNGDGLTGEEKSLILSLFKATAYTADMSATIAQLENLWGGTGGEEPDIPDEPDEPDVPTYKVANNLTGVTNSNTATTASGYYSATLSADDGYNISVTITMGGVDITDSVYTEDGTILITEVTGDIIITATAELATAPVLYQLANTPRTVNADLFEDTGLAFGTSTANGYTKAWTLVAKVKNMTAGTLWCVNGNTGLRSYYEKRWNGDAQNNVVHLTTAVCAAVSRPAITEANPDEICVVITKEAMSEKTATIYHLSYSGEMVSDVLVGSYGNFYHNMFAGSMMVGGQTSADFVGIIEEFTIYEGVAAEDQIKNYLGVA